MHSIYLITDTSSGTVYVGMTKNYKARIAAHQSALRRGTGHNPAMQKAYDKNPSSFTYELLDTCYSRVEAKVIEADWQQSFPSLFNVIVRKFNVQQVREIKGRLESGERVNKLAREYGTCHMVISHINNNSRPLTYPMY